MDRRSFLIHSGGWLVGLASRDLQGGRAAASSRITLFLAGDVMTGRGIDQVLPHPVDPRIFEGYVKDARRYVELAEAVNGKIPGPVGFDYIWGDALEELEKLGPDVRIANLETAVTRSDDYWRGKGINYRMHPENVPCLSAARLDCCVLANNHVLDWGYSGLAETLEILRQNRLRPVGAGRNRQEAGAPAILAVPGKGRVLVFAFGWVTSGIPTAWAAREGSPGVNLLTDLSDETVEQIGGEIAVARQPGDLVVASIHWGSNWGYRIPPSHQRFARQLIDAAGVDVVHGHSSHHPLGIEVYHDRLILYGCGDFVNDYEGIGGYEEFRGDLAVAYFVSLEAQTGRLVRLAMKGFQSRRFRLHRASRSDLAWLQGTLNREGRELGTRVKLEPADTLSLGRRGGAAATGSDAADALL